MKGVLLKLKGKNMSYYIKQIGEKDCAFACLKMLMAIVYKKRDFLFYPQIKIDQSYSFKEIIDVAAQEGITLIGFRYAAKNDILKQTNLPLLIPIYKNGISHMVLVKKIKGKKIVIYDPIDGIVNYKYDDLLSVWGGEALEVSNKTGSSFRFRNKQFFPKGLSYLTIIFQVLSFASLFAGLFFINDKYPFIISVLLLATYIVFEIIYNRLLIESMRTFDRNAFPYLIENSTKSFKDKYISMNNYKISLFGAPLQIITSGIILIAGVTIVGLNNYLNLIVVSLIFVITFLFKLFETKVINRRKNNSAFIEQKMFMTTSKEELEKEFNLLQKEVYKETFFFSSKKYLILFIAAIFSLILSSLSGAISINFVLFHTCVFYYIGTLFEKIIGFISSRNQNNYYKCLFNYYISNYNVMEV